MAFDTFNEALSLNPTENFPFFFQFYFYIVIEWRLNLSCDKKVKDPTSEN